jgi:hypothetical protein
MAKIIGLRLVVLRNGTITQPQETHASGRLTETLLTSLRVIRRAQSGINAPQTAIRRTHDALIEKCTAGVSEAAATPENNSRRGVIYTNTRDSGNSSKLFFSL